MPRGKAKATEENPAAKEPTSGEIKAMMEELAEARAKHEADMKVLAKEREELAQMRKELAAMRAEINGTSSDTGEMSGVAARKVTLDKTADFRVLQPSEGPKNARYLQHGNYFTCGGRFISTVDGSDAPKMPMAAQARAFVRVGA